MHLALLTIVQILVLDSAGKVKVLEWATLVPIRVEPASRPEQCFIFNINVKYHKRSSFFLLTLLNLKPRLFISLCLSWNVNI